MSDASTSYQIDLHNYLHLVGISIFYYDYVLTFSTEYIRVWRGPKPTGSWLFYVNRYLTFFGDIAVNVGNFYNFKTAKSCDDYALYRQILLIGAQVVVCIILCLRIYALYNRSKAILVGVVGTGATLMALAVFAVTGQSSSTALDSGCHLGESRITGIRELHDLSSLGRPDVNFNQPGVAVAWEALFLYDVLIFSLTMYKTWKNRAVYAISDARPNLVTLMMRDGALYFAVSVTMMSRLMLNLHESASANPTLVTDPSSSGQSTTLLFTSIIIGTNPQTERADIEGVEFDQDSMIPDSVEMQDMRPGDRHRDRTALHRPHDILPHTSDDSTNTHS
ncbi:hypothetical protein POSPLADRAFT_1045690 [Postia placenta MAD-698-R-SB12]|uniref:DUF6533 domain-containing protein n=1 Tax=Postia placenta MAD-698-R-SB12 TaxID=670580 RepID=A0A1X6N404_9APHY|nr:hypothetical protein POSPLADRAFT_1045690 [Postia placenta MAD-698-R-SB12]OSX63338.1 hypothetical protein POSPLADRAFT_1045690 [Postia placenta MAD-698-R-SB12]